MRSATARRRNRAAGRPRDDDTHPRTPNGLIEARKAFQEQLDELRVDVIRLAALTTEQIAGGTQALLDGDLTAAERVIEADDAIDELTHSIEDRTFQTLALQQPIATDLRFLVTVMRVAHELERSADLMVNVAKTTRRLYPHQLDPKLRGIIDRMGAQASVQTRVAIDAFADADPSQAAALADMDDAMDELTKSLFRHILAGDGSDEGRSAARSADGAGRAALRADGRPRGDDRGAGALHGDGRAPVGRRRPDRLTLGLARLSALRAGVARPPLALGQLSSS